MVPSPFATETSDLQVIEHLAAGAVLVADQLPIANRWSPERRLAGAVLAAALVEVRDHHTQSTYRRAVAEDLDWIFSDNADWPFNFVPLCHTVAVDPGYVRAMVRRWLSKEPEDRPCPQAQEGSRRDHVRTNQPTDLHRGGLPAYRIGPYRESGLITQTPGQ